MLRICTTCKCEKELTDFNRQKCGHKGRNRMCRECANKYKFKKRKRIKNGGKPGSIYPQYKVGTRDYTRNVYLICVYGITLDEYNRLLSIQDYRCGICKTPQTDLNKNLGVDHDHITGDVRGLLCFKCNAAIGKLNDDIRLLQNAISYLIRSKKSTIFAEEKQELKTEKT